LVHLTHTIHKPSVGQLRPPARHRILQRMTEKGIFWL
jgi:hypothetical protein